jgi:hypothetical protein
MPVPILVLVLCSTTRWSCQVLCCRWWFRLFVLIHDIATSLHMMSPVTLILGYTCCYLSCDDSWLWCRLQYYQYCAVKQDGHVRCYVVGDDLDYLCLFMILQHHQTWCHQSLCFSGTLVASYLSCDDSWFWCHLQYYQYCAVKQDGHVRCYVVGDDLDYLCLFKTLIFNILKK